MIFNQEMLELVHLFTFLRSSDFLPLEGELDKAVRASVDDLTLASLIGVDTREAFVELDLRTVRDY